MPSTTAILGFIVATLCACDTTAGKIVQFDYLLSYTNSIAATSANNTNLPIQPRFSNGSIVKTYTYGDQTVSFTLPAPSHFPPLSSSQVVTAPSHGFAAGNGSVMVSYSLSSSIPALYITVHTLLTRISLTERHHHINIHDLNHTNSSHHPHHQ
jgi:hypothetical protein